MSLKWPLALLILMLPVATALYRRRKPQKRGRQFIAESLLASKLPSYGKRARRAKRWRRLEYGLLGLMFLLLGWLIARPQQAILKINEEKSRDVVMCLDTSGSMSEFIPGAVTTLGNIADKNRTDRFSIVLFQNSYFTVLPLTRDSVAIKDRVKFLQEGFKEGADFNAVQDLGYDYNLEGGTDVGAGLIGCIKRFDNLNKEKSRNLIIISDMEHNGATDYLEVAQLIPKYKIRSFVLAPYIDSIKESDFTTITNSTVGSLDSTADVNKILENIFRQIFNVETGKSYTQTDNPQPYIAFLMVVLAAYGYVVSKRWRSL